MSAVVLVIAAHPDDEVLGAGGLLALTPGAAVALVSEGTSAQPEQETPWARRLEKKQQAARAAAGLLGATLVAAGAFPDQQLRVEPALVRWIEQVLDRVRPDLVVTHSAAELNQDHRVVAEAVQVATRPWGAYRPRLVLSFAVDWLGPGGVRWAPSLFLPLTEAAFALKVEALRAYATELRPAPHPRSPAALEAQARYWGVVAGCPLAEAYAVHWGLLGAALPDWRVSQASTVGITG